MIGYQSINCKSYVEPAKKSNAFTFLISLCNFRILNLKNETCRNLINKAINHPNLEEKNIKKEISKDTVYCRSLQPQRISQLPFPRTFRLLI